MRVVLIVLGFVIVLAIGFQSWVMYVSNTEEQPYKLLATFDGIEIRHYPAARMASYQYAANNASEGSGFRALAGYIFGGNSEQIEFAMTAPVHMEKSKQSEKMSFVLPQESWHDSLPTPSNSNVTLHWSKAQDVAVIQFRGFRTKDLENQYTQLLIEKLKELGISHFNDFRILGYDPPFKVNNRRNEIIVSIDKKTLPHSIKK